jgi:hypothetical protein
VVWKRLYPWTMDSLYAFKCERFRNTTFGIPLYNSFWNTLHYQWKSHWTVTILGKTLCALLHCDSQNRVYVLWINLHKRLKVVKLFLKHPVHSDTISRLLEAKMAPTFVTIVTVSVVVRDSTSKRTWSSPTFVRSIHFNRRYLSFAET